MQQIVGFRPSTPGEAKLEQKGFRYEFLCAGIPEKWDVLTILAASTQDFCPRGRRAAVIKFQ
jgi:hypothetical protein